MSPASSSLQTRADAVNEGSGFAGFHAPELRPRRRRNISIRAFLALEKRVLEDPVTTAVPESIPEPADAVATLGALACRYANGERLSLREIGDAAGISMAAASAVRRWARSVDRWPYRESLGFAGQRRHRQRKQIGGAS